MRAPKRKRPRRRECLTALDAGRLKELAPRARYIGSPEHKEVPSFAGWPRPRADASICDPEFTTRQGEITEWLQAAIRRGHIGGPWDGDFPRYAWHRQQDVVYEARLVNRESGEYKGYPLESDEWPKGLE